MRFPKGVKKTIDLYKGKIAAVAGGWVDWMNPIGCGSFGCVFNIWTKDLGYDQPGSQALITDRVLKISTDPTEGPVVSAIMKTGLDKRLTGLARWYGVWRIPEPIQTGPRGTGWVILREEVRPFNHIEDMPINVFGGRSSWVTALRDYNITARRSIELKRPWMKRMAEEQASEAVMRLYNEPGTYYVAEAIDALGREGIVLADIHHGNLGFRIHPTDEQPLETAWWGDQKERPPLLIFDPGHSSAPEETKVEALWQLAGKANPWMEGEKQEIEAL